ncbi:MAG: NGG1p interacting factor NIF3 [Syntrophomonas sp.]
MKLKDIYQMAVELGKAYDVRGVRIEHLLQDKKKSFDKLSDSDKTYFDPEELHNPYHDCRILQGIPETEIQTVFCGIDMETPEIILADRLRERGQQIDLVLAHHPEGIAQAAMHEVLKLQSDLLEKFGVPINIAESILASRISEVKRGMAPLNHQRAVDAARLLNLPFMCVHTPADNLAAFYLQKFLDGENPASLSDIVDLLHTIPEYQTARRLKAGPALLVGEKKRRTGRILVKFSGGTSGPEKAFEKMAQAGVGTYICMHIPDKHRQAARENHVNVIVAGHMASDSLGMNLFLDHLEQRGIKIIAGSGLIRVRRDSESGLELPNSIKI